MRRRLHAAATAVLTAVLAINVAAAGPAAADTAHVATVSTNPVDYTPHVLDGTVWDVTLVGPSTVVVAGDFSEVSDSTGKTIYPRDNLFAYNLTTGAVLPLSVQVDGPVYAVVGSADGSAVYLGGAFKKINGVAQRGLAKLTLATNTRDAAFTGVIAWGDVRELAISGSWLYAGGPFTGIGGLSRTALARLNLTTGAADPAFDAKITAPSLSRARVEDFAISPNGTRLVAIGAIQYAGGVRRTQLAMYDLTTPAPTLVDWYTNAYTAPCRKGFETYMRGIDFAPDNSYFVVVTTGRASDPKKLCDTAARFNTAGTGAQSPVWVNHTGGDSLYTASITGPSVYVGGHQRWQNNPFGHESAGKGAVAREGIAALDPVTGLAQPWNPTRARGVGVRAMLATSAGLIVGSDTERLGKEYHGRIGMFPLA
jgi:beta-propeller uncharacterized protein DUF5122